MAAISKSPSGNPKKPKTYRRRNSARFISRPELAALVGVHIETIKRWEAAGRLPPSFRPGGKLAFYDREQVEKALQESLT